MRRLTTAICIAAAVPVCAHADEAADKERGESIWREGAKQYDLSQFDAAIKKFEEAYEVHPDPKILFNLGQAHRKINSNEKAIHYFRSYLRYRPQASNRAVVEDIIKELEKLVLAQKTSKDHPPDTVHVPPATGAADAPAPGAPAAGASTVAQSSPSTPSAPITSAAPVDESRWYQDPVAWTLAGAGIVALGIGTGCLIHSSGLSTDAGNAKDQADAQSLHDSAHTFQLAGGITLGVGAALVTGGIVKMLLHGHSHTQAPPDSKLTVSLGFRGLALSGSF